MIKALYVDYVSTPSVSQHSIKNKIKSVVNTLQAGISKFKTEKFLYTTNLKK